MEEKKKKTQWCLQSTIEYTRYERMEMDTHIKHSNSLQV